MALTTLLSLSSRRQIHGWRDARRYALGQFWLNLLGFSLLAFFMWAAPAVHSFLAQLDCGTVWGCQSSGQTSFTVGPPTPYVLHAVRTAAGEG